MYQLIGKITVFFFAARLLYYVWTLIRLYVLPKFGLRQNLKKYGEWAVVTGSTDGIGQEYARQLAKKGLKIVLISRSKDKLDKTADEIKKEFNVEVKTVVFDFDNIDGYEKIATEINGLDIGVLVNNVGVSYGFPDYFLDVDIKILESMVRVNCFSMLKMTHLILPGMRDRKRGVIINVSSAAALRPMPLLSVYSAAKSFVEMLSRGIQIEYKKYGIICQIISPFFVSTNMSGNPDVSLLIPSAQEFVRQALETSCNTPSSCGCLVHDLMKEVLMGIPGFVYGDTALAAVEKRKTQKQALLKRN